MKMIHCCKKHYKKIMKGFTSVEYSEKIGAINYISGVKVCFYIKPYLKKVRIIDLDSFKLRLESPELEMLDHDWRSLHAWGVKELKVPPQYLKMGTA